MGPSPAPPDFACPRSTITTISPDVSLLAETLLALA